MNKLLSTDDWLAKHPKVIVALMILKEIELKPLAGIPDHLFRFEKKLSVILGPNEAGKSTLYNALKLA